MATAGGGGDGYSGGGGDDRGFHPLRRTGRPRYDRHLSRNDIGNQSRVLLTRFIHDRMEASGLPNAPNPEDLIDTDTPSGPPVEHIQQVADALKRIGDELDGDEHLQSLISGIPEEASMETFSKVAQEIFQDGIFNWGRVVTLFYFAFKMAVRYVEKALDMVPFIKKIIEMVVQFIVDHVASWIIERGGWESIQEYFGATNGQMIAVVVAGLLCSVLSVAYVAYKKT